MAPTCRRTATRFLHHRRDPVPTPAHALQADDQHPRRTTPRSTATTSRAGRCAFATSVTRPARSPARSRRPDLRDHRRRHHAGGLPRLLPPVPSTPTDHATTLARIRRPSRPPRLRHRRTPPSSPGSTSSSRRRRFANDSSGTADPFTLDGRWLHAFNGPGMTTNAVYGNFRYNGHSSQPQRRGHGRGLRRLRPGELVPGDPERRRPVIIPSFHRPAIIRYRPERTANGRSTTGRDTRYEHHCRPGPTRPRGSSAPARPTATTPTTFPDLDPDATGKITYDVDNDGDGVTDSVWVDLGYPARRERAGPALQAAVRLHGHRPQRPDPAQHGRQPGRRARGTDPSTHASHLGNSVSEIDPTYALQNAFDPAPDVTGLHAPALSAAFNDLVLTPRWTAVASTSG